MHPEILDTKRQQIFKKLAFTGELGMYLAGGTALALQIGHRTSVDFDFYLDREFKEGEFRRVFEQHLSEWRIKFIRDYDNTIELEADEVHLSCFYYHYKLLRPLVKLENIQLASIEDLAAMKLIAISQRGNFRDFADIYYLIKEFGLPQILELTQAKYETFDPYTALRGLLYFEDAEKDAEKKRINLFDETLDWPKIKEIIRQTTIEYQKSFILDKPLHNQ